MPSIVFLNPPNHEHDVLDLAPPLGLMKLAAIARRRGWQPSILDFALNACANPDSLTPDSFYEHAVARAVSTDPSVVCVTSMGVNSHVALELARQIRLLLPTATVWAGGIHLGSIANWIQLNCPWIDAVFVGEAEQSFKRALELLEQSHSVPGCVPSMGGDDLCHPHEMYDLVDLSEYFSINPRRVINYEGGRGCVFECAFCYSPEQYPTVSERDPHQVVSDWRALSERGVRHVFMVQDNFTNSPNRAIEMCRAIAEASLPVDWNGYLTLPQLNIELARQLGAARCRQMYLGVDAVTPLQQVTFNKRFLKSDDTLVRKLALLRDNGVAPTCAFMLDLYRYDEHEVEAVLSLAAQCASLGVAIRLNTFTRYPLSALSQRREALCRYSEAKVRMMLDCPEVVRVNPLAREAPDSFPFHATEVPDEAEWVRRLRQIWLAQRLVQAFPDDVLAMSCQGGKCPIVRGLEGLAGDMGSWHLLSTPNDSLDSRNSEVY